MRCVIKKFLLFVLSFVIVIVTLPLVVVNFYKPFLRESGAMEIDDLKIKLYRHEKDKVEEIPLEKYLEGVLVAEMPAKFNIEALKAQAVASRTYAYSKMMNKNKLHDVADVCDTVHSQAYIDEKDYEKKFGDKTEEYITKIRKAIQETSSKVLVYDGKIVENALYFAVSSGLTEDALEVYSFSEPYLKSVESPFDKDVPNSTKQYIFKEDEIVNKINKEYRQANVKSFDDIEVLKYTKAGSVEKIRLGDEVVRGLDFRYLLNLNSSNMKMTKQGDDIIIDVKGYGHGVGLSQWGAGKMSELGYDYEKILKHYYTGVEIQDIGSI